jgi:HEAT repeat protein
MFSLPVRQGSEFEALAARLGHEAASERRAAARALGRGGDRRAVPLLLGALGDPQPGVRRAAMGALEQLGEGLLVMVIRDIWRGSAEVVMLASDGRLVGPLLAALRAPDAGVRCAAAAALGHLGDARATPELSRSLEDPVAPVRIAAACALGAVRDARALEALLAALRRSREEQQRIWPEGWSFQNSLLAALARLQDERALPALVAALDDPLLAPQAARALGVLGDRRAASAR